MLENQHNSVESCNIWVLETILLLAPWEMIGAYLKMTVCVTFAWQNLHEGDSDEKASEAVSTRRRSRASSRDIKGKGISTKGSGFPSPDHNTVSEISYVRLCFKNRTVQWIAKIGLGTLLHVHKVFFLALVCVKIHAGFLKKTSVEESGWSSS